MTSSTQTRKILIVEDNAIFGFAISRAFTKFGYDSRHAINAKEALDVLQEYIPDIILSDYEMPGMNGFEFRKRLLQNPLFRDIPFVFLTSHSNEELILKGLNLNALDYIIKGTPNNVVTSKVDTILNSLQHEHEKSVAELRKAAETLQINSIPHTMPEIEGFDIRFWNKSYENYLGGDFMDYIHVDDQFTFLFLGDIMGKKWQAWFYTFGYLSYIRAAIRLCIMDKQLSCLEIMQKINKVICRDESLKNILSSLSLLILDRQRGTISYTGAGDLPLLHYNNESRTLSIIRASGLLLGLREDGDYDELLIQLQEGDKLLVFTDGLTDILEDGHKKSNFSTLTERLLPLLEQTGSFESIKNNLLADFAGGRQLDDASLIFIERIKAEQ